MTLPHDTPKVVGLGLKLDWSDFPALDAQFVARVRAAFDADAEMFFIHGLVAQDYANIFAEWRKLHASAKVGMAPFGKFSREVAQLYSADDNLVFFDRSPSESTRSYDDISPKELDYVVISSPAYQDDIRRLMVAKGFAEHRIVTVEKLLEYLLFCPGPKVAAGLAERLLGLRQPRKRMAVVSMYGSGHEFIRVIKEKGATFELFADPAVFRHDLNPVQRNTLHLGGYTDEYSHAVVACSPDRYTDAFNDLCVVSQTKADVIFPFLDKGEWPAEAFLDFAPVVVYMPEFAGTRRMQPTFASLAAHLKRNHIHHNEGRDNPVLLDHWWRKKRRLPPMSLRDQCLKGACLSLMPFDYLTVHLAHRLECLKDLPWLKILVLLRDPRDILNSSIFKFLEDNPGMTYEAVGLRLLKGTMHVPTPTKSFPVPPFGVLLDSYRYAASQPNARFIRFEDIHDDPRKAYLDALEWLHWLPARFRPLSDDDLDDAIALSSFKRQTLGQLVRGRENNANTWVNGCRKGTVGDWRNHMTERLKNHFKALADDTLNILGYEVGDGW
ncbi:sulfotransferase domain-containing protein [Desulfovibrio sulfodismutans]|uniref:Sulfotransferase domain-containing protein n=1 Tax=Desulfolutivibrio sulfodismutans TaxID=63561 RepID=A0A7K3NIT9_9BACT|nr:sulfotransferase domain-containing protein [Desulfolutivibrio sulfodismutans]NDY56121.1 sulfotransferase domain-containing protein [Desulfolutivibrio sulfodismutans]QLA13174.1 hypothetical protein GD606_13300 [Desulfolutivibrio sulfodismutans DSM 3696]